MKYIKKILLFLFVAFIFWFVDTYCVDALQNSGALSNLTIADTGRFYNNTGSSSSSSIGYQITNINDDYYLALPTGNTTFNYNGFGGSLVQCGMSFAQGNYYSVTYYYLSDSMSYYYHPYYTQLSNKLAIGDNVNINRPTFTYENVNTDIQRQTIEGYGFLSSYTVIFKAPNTGTCLLSAFSSNPTSPSDGLAFVGYKYESLGSSQLSANDIQNALSGSFNSINISINSSTNSINANIDSMKDKQEETNQKLDEQHETSKGIWGSIKELVTGIPNWFSNLASSIGDFFSNLINALGEGLSGLFDGIKSLFYGEEVCEDVSSPNYFKGYEGYTPDSDGWITFDLTHNGGITNYFYKAPPVADFDSMATYNVFIEIAEFESTVQSGTFNPIGNFPSNASYKAQFGTSGPLFSINNYTIKNDYNLGSAVYVKGNLYNFIKPANSGSSSSYSNNIFTNLFVQPSSSGTIHVKFRVLITDDMSMTVDNYSYSSKECTTSSGLFGLITNGIKSIGDFFINLLNGILDGLKALFIPEDGYFSEYFSSLYDFFNEKLGILIYPVDLLLNIFNRFINLNAGTGLIHIPDISLGSFGTIIHARDFYINEYWSTEPYHSLYNIYKIFVNAFVGFCLVRLAYKKEKEITSGGVSS